MAYRDEVLADSPIAYWRLGETVGATTMATEVGSLDGTYDATNPPTLETPSLLASTSDTCGDFDGSADFASRTDDALLDLTSNFCLEAWVTTDTVATGDRRYMGKGQPGVSGYCAGRNFANPRFTNMGVAFYDFGGVTLVVGTTYHMVFNFDSSFDVQLIMDGVDQGTVAGGSAVATNSDDLRIGSASGGGAGEFWDGKIDEVAVYASTLSVARALAHYVAGTTTGQILYPDADVDAGDWTATPLWSKVEEAAADGTVITATAS